MRVSKNGNDDRVTDVLTETTLKIIDVLTVMGHRCPESYHLGFREEDGAKADKTVDLTTNSE